MKSGGAGRPEVSVHAYERDFWSGVLIGNSASHGLVSVNVAQSQGCCDGNPSTLQQANAATEMKVPRSV
jgi:hypothetical protein